MSSMDEDKVTKETTKPRHVIMAEAKANRLARRNRLAAVYLFIALFLALSWLLGVWGCSFVWVFLMGLMLYAVWNSRVAGVVRQYMQEEEVLLQRKRTLKRSETVEWLNFIVNRWWVFSSASIEDLVKKRLDSRLLKVKPSFVERIELTHFEMGEQTPFIKSLNMFEYDECQPGGQKSVTWSDIMTPPRGLCAMSTYHLVMEADVGLMCDDFSMVLRSRIGTEQVGLNVDMEVENLNITGKMQIILQMSMDVPFPHFSKATVYFTEQPDIWFNVRCLHSLQVMELPLIRTWIHTHVMEGLSDALVDPGKIDIKLGRMGPRVMGPQDYNGDVPLAVGVLTVTMTCTAGIKLGHDDVTYANMRMTSADKLCTREVVGRGQWHDCFSFLIHNLGSDKLLVKHKLKRLLTSTTLGAHTIPLSTFPFPVERTATQDVESMDGGNISLKLNYAPLTEVNVDITAPEDKAESKKGLSGVMYIKIHGASGLIAGDRDDSSDPYCVVYCDRKKILTTPYVPRTRTPTWESDVEFFVSDYSKKTYSFFVYDWDGSSMLDDDFLGSTFFTMSSDKPSVIRNMLTLGYNKPTEGYIENQDYGVLCVSAVFRSVESVGVSEKYREAYDGVTEPLATHTAGPYSLNSPSADPVLRSDKVNEFRERLLESRMFVELGIVSARDLVAGDKSGFSDPYAEVIVNKKRVYKTSAKKKTLNPVWDETATFYMTDEDKFIDVMVYDKDFLGRDFLGSVQLNIDQLKALSINQTSTWYTLEKTKHGEIQLQCSILTKKSSDSQGTKVPTISVYDHNSNIAGTGRVPRVHEPGEVATDEPLIKGDQGNQRASNHSELRATSQPPHEGSVSRRDNAHSPPPHSDGDHTGLDSPQPSIGDTANLRHRSTLRRAEIPIDRISTVSTMSMSGEESYYDVKGVLIQSKGLTVPNSDIYCRIRLDRIKRGHSSLRTLAKSGSMRTYFVTQFNVAFEVDKGHGIAKDAMLIVDFKKDKKDTISSRSYSLRDLIRDAPTGKKMQTWLAYDTDIEIEMTLCHSEPDPNKLRKGGVFKSLSFTRRSNTDLHNT